MGVQGWTTFLEQQGFLPGNNNNNNSSSSGGGTSSSCTCGNRTSLWRTTTTSGDADDSDDSSLSLFHVEIPHGSTLHIDGNGLCFYLHQVAYARHVTQVLSENVNTSSDNNNNNNNNNDRQSSSSKKKKKGGKEQHQQQEQQSASPSSNNNNKPGKNNNAGAGRCLYCACIKKQANASRRGRSGSLLLSPDNVRRLIPTFMPLHLLHEVTTEFVTTLQQQHKFDLRIYWDGPKRHVYKQATDEHRQENLSQEWSLLRVYLETGVMPTRSNNKFASSNSPNNSPIEYWEGAFPKNRLAFCQIMYTLRQTLRLSAGNDSMMISCEEEADAVMARAASHKPNHFVLGQDSDFCFFAGIQYIPFGTLSSLSATCPGGKKKVVMSAIVLKRSEIARALDLIPRAATTQESGDEDAHHEDDSVMVELALLLGNDYIDSMYPLASAIADANSNAGNARGGGSNPNGGGGGRRFFPDVATVVDFLREQGPDYRVVSASATNPPCVETERTLDFCRRLYNHDISPSNSSSNNDDDERNDGSSSQLQDKSVSTRALRQKDRQEQQKQKAKKEESERFDLEAGDEILSYHETETMSGRPNLPSTPLSTSNRLRPSVPSDVPIELLAIDARLDRSAKDAVLRCLQAYLDLQTTTTTTTTTATGVSRTASPPPPLTQEHLDVFREMPIVTDTTILDFYITANNTTSTRRGGATMSKNGVNNTKKKNNNKDASISTFHGIVPQQLHQHVPKQQQQQKQAQNGKKDDVSAKKNNNWQPQWQDIPAAYLIGKMIGMVIGQQKDNPIAQLFAPFQLFSQEEFHARLRERRNKAKELLFSSPQSTTTSTNNGIAHHNQIATPKTPSEYKPPSMFLFEQTPPPPQPVAIASTPVKREKLPIDEHEQTILNKIARNQVTIIQGETGCGKSSRIPVFLLKSSQQSEQVKLFLAQPRRIAAKGLVERIRSTEPDLRDQIALRMGHGMREYETSHTRAWFVTTGYLVRLLANHPERFQSITHIIIDEVHERSVDTDILCLLCRRLLQQHSHIRLVLMSATLSAAMYQDYFDVPEPPIKVGAKRFPVREVFLEDLMGPSFLLQQKVVKTAGHLLEQCNNMKCRGAPPMSYMEKLFSLVANLAVTVGQPGSAVLIFVPGMNEILAITELIEQLFVPGVRFTCLPVHSDIPFEDQMNVFETAAEDECRIVIATNSAESSVTLPALDHVICLGLCKQIVYNEMSHRQILLPTWISRASATQRAGRTGRLRPGTVYRCYSRNCYNNYMAAHEPGEMRRIPLDSVILCLKGILSEEDGVTDALLDCLEPPNVSTIDRSFQSLHQSHFITSPGDDGNITTLGSFVSAMGIDLSLGSLIGLGIQFGVGAEAIAMAGCLSFPKPPWIMSNPLVHDTNSFNKMTAKTYTSRCHFDAALFSEPLASMNLLWEYENTSQNKMGWCKKYGVVYARVKRLASTCENLQKRVAGFLDLPTDALDLEAPPVNMPPAKITILRVIQVWCFHDTIMEFQPKLSIRGLSKSGVNVELKSKSGSVTSTSLDQVLCKERHPYEIRSYTEIEQKGSFKKQKEADPLSFLPPAFEDRLLSLAMHDDLDLAWVKSEKYFVLYVHHRTSLLPEFGVVLDKLQEQVADGPTTFIGEEVPLKQQKGFRERACGLYSVHRITDVWGNDATDDLKYYRFGMAGVTGNESKSLDSQLGDFIRLQASASGISCTFFQGAKSSGSYRLKTMGSRARTLSAFDRNDLFPFELFDKCVTKHNAGNQSVFFEATTNTPMDNGAKRKACKNEESSWERPLFECIPEGARILSVLASGRRRDHFIRFEPNTNAEQGGSDAEATEAIDIYPEPSQSKITFRWKRFATDSVVYVQENSVPASAVPMDGTSILYCVCANTLEVRGGGLRAEGLTLLPPGKLFLLLCRFSFGLFNKASHQSGTLLRTSIEWLSGKDIDAVAEDAKQDWEDRMEKAISLHETTSALGEELVCSLDSVEQLVNLFDGLDGIKCKIWDDLYSNPFTRANLNGYY